MKKKLLIILLSILTFSCTHLDKGTVIEKNYEPPRTYVTLMPISTGKTVIMIPYIIYDNEDYILTVEGVKDEDVIHENVYVSEDCYKSLSIGETWNKTEDCSFNDDNNVKKRK